MAYIPPMSSPRCLAIGLTLWLMASGLVVPGEAGAKIRVPGTPALPVLATFEVHQYEMSEEPVAFGAVHGVRRIEGGTVLYFSLGFPKDRGTNVRFLGTTRRVTPNDRWGIQGIWATQFLVDPVGKHAYTTLVKEENGDCLCSIPEATEDQSGKLYVLYAVLPPLPPETRTVHVGLGFDTIVQAIPVQDGVLTPEVDPNRPILVGQGWPRIDLAAVAAAPDKERSISPLETRVSDLARQVTTVESPGTVSLELASDVLFALDSADLTPAAQDTIARAAATINQRARGGTISVVGHTDDSGSDAYNDRLSQQRAAAVRQALEPLVKVPGVTYVVEGKGEREPVETNSTEEGRRTNRRVAITFGPKAGE